MTHFFAEQGRTRIYAETYFLYVAGKNPRRTPLSGKMGHLWMDTDMVDSCQEEKSFLSNCFPAVLVVDRIQGTQRGGTYVTTVDHSDIRGLVTA